MSGVLVSLGDMIWYDMISGRPLAASRATDRESSPVKDQRSAAVPRNYYAYLISLSRYDDLLVENLRGRRFNPPESRLKHL